MTLSCVPVPCGRQLGGSRYGRRGCSVRFISYSLSAKSKRKQLIALLKVVNNRYKVVFLFSLNCLLFIFFLHLLKYIKKNSLVI